MRSRIRRFKKFMAEFLCAAFIACSMSGLAFAAERGDKDGGSCSSASFHSCGEGLSSSKSSKSSNSIGSGIIWTRATIVPTKGTWTIDEYGRWRFTDGYGRRYSNEWGYIYDPYAGTGDDGLPIGNWYHFGNDGIMDIGWYSDRNRKVYYLDPNPDNKQGAMVTGWGWIDGKWYYFDENGELLRNAQTPDGYYVDGTGVRVERYNYLTFPY